MPSPDRLRYKDSHFGPEFCQGLSVEQARRLLPQAPEVSLMVFYLPPISAQFGAIA